jgi:hypothetical protein
MAGGQNPAPSSENLQPLVLYPGARNRDCGSEQRWLAGDLGPTGDDGSEHGRSSFDAVGPAPDY